MVRTRMALMVTRLLLPHCPIALPETRWTSGRFAKSHPSAPLGLVAMMPMVSKEIPTSAWTAASILMPLMASHPPRHRPPRDYEFFGTALRRDFYTLIVAYEMNTWLPSGSFLIMFFTRVGFFLALGGLLGGFWGARLGAEHLPRDHSF